MKELILTSSLILFSTVMFSQEQEYQKDTLSVQMNYSGMNLFVKNPFDSNGGLGFTCEEVFVNGKLSDTKINQSAFEIKLGDRKEGEEITIEIVYRSGSKPVILNLKDKK